MALLEGVNYPCLDDEKLSHWAMLFNSKPQILNLFQLINCCDNKDKLPPITEQTQLDICTIRNNSISINIKGKVFSEMIVEIFIDEENSPHIVTTHKKIDTDTKASFIQWYNAVPKNWELTLKTQSELFTTRAEADQLTRDEFITRLKEIGVTCNPAYFGQW